MCTTMLPRLRKARNRLLCGESEALLREALQLFNDAPRFTLRSDASRDSYGLASRIERHLSGGRQPVPPAPSPLTIPARNEPSAGEVLIEGSHGWFIADASTGAILRRGPACTCDDGCEAHDVPAGGAYGCIARVEPSTLWQGERHADVIHVGTYDAAGAYEPPCGECVECEKVLFAGHCQNPDCQLYSPAPAVAKGS